MIWRWLRNWDIVQVLRTIAVILTVGRLVSVPIACSTFSPTTIYSSSTRVMSVCPRSTPCMEVTGVAKAIWWSMVSVCRQPSTTVPYALRSFSRRWTRWSTSVLHLPTSSWQKPRVSWWSKSSVLQVFWIQRLRYARVRTRLTTWWMRFWPAVIVVSAY